MRSRLLSIATLSALFVSALVGACSSSSDSDGPKGFGGMGTGGTGTGATGATASTGGSGAIAGTGGGTSGTGGGFIEAGTQDVGLPPDAPCSEVSESAGRPAVDIIFVVDNSGSMTDEIEKVRAGINDFANIISASNIDWRVIMVSERGTSGRAVCVPEPLAGPNCADKPPQFFHVPCTVGSSDSLSIAANSYHLPNPFGCGGSNATWNMFARPNSTKVFVFVTDDEAEFPFINGDTFDSVLLNNPPFAGNFGTPIDRGYVVHSITGYNGMDIVNACQVTDGDGGLVNSAVEPGIEYIQLAQVTGGIFASICDDDWTPTFDTIADGIIDTLSCEYPVPPPADGGSIDPGKVNVKFTAGDGQDEIILQDNNSECDAGADGWQWNQDNTRILLCGEACNRISSDLDGSIALQFGCETRVVPPPR